jgi:hypothetical protein
MLAVLFWYAMVQMTLQVQSTLATIIVNAAVVAMANI